MEVSSSSLNTQRLKDGNAELCRLTHMITCMLENDVFVNVKNNNKQFKKIKRNILRKILRKCLPNF